MVDHGTLSFFIDMVAMGTWFCEFKLFQGVASMAKLPATVTVLPRFATVCLFSVISNGCNKKLPIFDHSNLTLPRFAMVIFIGILFTCFT